MLVRLEKSGSVCSYHMNLDDFILEGDSYYNIDDEFEYTSGVIKNKNNIPIGNINKLELSNIVPEYSGILSNSIIDKIKTINMINISNKVVMFNITKESDDFIFTGSLKVNEENEIESIDGLFKRDNELLGNFHYLCENGKISRSLNNVHKDLASQVDVFTTNLISEIIDELNK